MRNILVTSISKKVPLLKQVHQAVHKFNNECKLIGADTNSCCVGRYFVDQFWEMPPLEHLKIEDFIEYCDFHHIHAVIPTRDAELYFFSTYKQELKKNDIHVMVSHRETISLCQDKLLFFEELSKIAFPAIPSYFNQFNLPFDRIVVKERNGWESKRIAVNVDKFEALKVAENMVSPIFQPYIEGSEYSIDLYLNRNHKVKGCIARSRDYIVSGESQITTSIKHDKLEQLISRLAEEMKLYGHVIFQAIIDREDEIHIIECNPRFGGASTLSIEMGLDSFYWFILEANGIDLDTIPFVRSDKEKKLIRYPEDMII